MYTQLLLYITKLVVALWHDIEKRKGKGKGKTLIASRGRLSLNSRLFLVLLRSRPLSVRLRIRRAIAQLLTKRTHHNPIRTR